MNNFIYNVSSITYCDNMKIIEKIKYGFRNLVIETNNYNSGSFPQDFYEAHKEILMILEQYHKEYCSTNGKESTELKRVINIYNKLLGVD